MLQHLRNQATGYKTLNVRQTEWETQTVRVIRTGGKTLIGRMPQILHELRELQNVGKYYTFFANLKNKREGIKKQTEKTNKTKLDEYYTYVRRLHKTATLQHSTVWVSYFSNK